MDVSIAALLLFVMILVVVTLIIVVSKAIFGYRQKAHLAGYASLGGYLRSAPRDDEEKRDAVDLLLKGVVICLLGLVFPPLLLLGVFPLFFGARKVAYAQMGFGLSEDADPPSA
jgi:hypothetical protein